MRTIVYQSFRTTQVPAWVETCLGTVKQWAAGNSYDYQFVGDELFDHVPAWFREKAGGHICVVADLARLVLARKLLAGGYDRTVWVDADMVVFDPKSLQVGIGSDFAFCQETWLNVDEGNQARCIRRVNNSITAFVRGNVHLDFFIDSCERVARHYPVLRKLDVSTRFLSELSKILPMQLFANVGMFSPPILADIATGTDGIIKSYMERVSAPLACANLCGSLVGQPFRGVAMDADVYQAVVDKCLETGGGVVNRWFIGPGGRLLNRDVSISSG